MQPCVRAYPNTDWASMAHSLEVRVPLVDAALLCKITPWILARSRVRAAASKAALAGGPVRPLPSAVVTRAKTGFTTPIARWLQADWLPSSRTAAEPRKVPPTAHWSRQWAERLAVA